MHCLVGLLMKHLLQCMPWLNANVLCDLLQLSVVCGGDNEIGIELCLRCLLLKVFNILFLLWLVCRVIYCIYSTMQHSNY